MPALARLLDPRRSIAAAVGWLVFALSIGLVAVAIAWVGDVVRGSVLDQRARQLDRAAERIAGDLDLDLALRMQSVRALAALLGPELRDENRAALRTMLENLQRATPEFQWIGVADAHGRVLAATHGVVEGTSVSERSWFVQGLAGARIDEVRHAPMTPGIPPPGNGKGSAPLVGLIAPVIDARGVTVGVIGTQMSTDWLQGFAGGPGKLPAAAGHGEALVVDGDGTVLFGPAHWRGRHWAGTPAPPSARAAGEPGHGPRAWPARVERLDDGASYLVAGAQPVAGDALRALGWNVVVLEPLHDAAQSARALQLRIAAILLGLGLLAAALGVVLARRLTRDLLAITRSAVALRRGVTEAIVVPPGRSEAARLGRALDGLLASLRRERAALRALNAELDQRVASRTREIERLAEQARYDAVARERLTIARDLHDTLAHSMMAMLAEIRLLKRLLAVDPGAVAAELARAETTAREGLQEARAAIARMRFNPVRDAGLAAALADFVAQFVERTGIRVDFTSDAPPGAFADERAETLFRMAEEAMRNVERHAGATQVRVALRATAGGDALTLAIEDDGVGFDPQAAHPGHYGLAGLREQARLIGAALDVRSAPGQGTTITVTLATAPDA